MVKKSSKSSSGSSDREADLLRWVRENPPDSAATHSRSAVLLSKEEATHRWDERVERDQRAATVSSQRAAALQRTYGPQYRDILRASGRASAQAWARTHFPDSTAVLEEEDSDFIWSSATANSRPRISSEELIRDALSAITELGIVPNFGNNIALREHLEDSDPVIARRLGILRLRFHPESIPSASTYRELILLVCCGLQTLAPTVTGFLQDRRQRS
jgi:hypothetical protein